MKVVERIAGTAPCPLVLTCEHAANAIPEGVEVSSEDLPWLETHWGWDIGAADVTRYLARRMESFAVLSLVSRLVCDANRCVEAETWARREVEGHLLSFNASLEDGERKRREERYHAPFHRAVDEALTARLQLGGDVLLFSVHSFTPNYMGSRRDMEMGVVYDAYDAVAERFAGHLRDQGFITALNAPYSGYEEMIYSANLHGRKHGVLYLELEIRNDLIATREEAEEVGERIAKALDALKIRRKRRKPEA